MNLLYPVPSYTTITQTYAEHVARAKLYGWCWQPGTGCRTYYYGGIDYGVLTGTQIRAAQAGTVIKAGWDDPGNPKYGYGRRIYIQHAEGYLTIYAHLDSMRVAEKDLVQPGQVIGLSDNTGNSTGPHLHFELRLNGIPMDPAPLLTTTLDVTPAPTPAPAPLSTFLGAVEMNGMAFETLRVVNVRNGPGIGYPVIAQLDVGTQIKALRLHSISAWVEFEPGKFCALTYQALQYLKAVQ